MALLPEDIVESAIVPGEAMRFVATASNEGCDVRIGDKVAEFRKGPTIWTALLLEGDYPDWAPLIAHPTSGRLETDAGELRAAVDLARLFADPQTDEIQLKPSGTALNVAAHRTAGGIDHTIDAEADINAPVVVNGRYLADALRPLKEARVRFEFSDDMSRFIIREDQLVQMILTIRR